MLLLLLLMPAAMRDIQYTLIQHSVHQREELHHVG